MAQRKILCVASDNAVNKRWCMTLTAEGYEVASAARIQHAVQLLSAERFDLVIVGYNFPDAERASLAALARAKYQVPALLVCAFDSDRTIRADEYLAAAESDESLMETVAVVLLRNEKLVGQRRASAKAGQPV